MTPYRIEVLRSGGVSVHRLKPFFDNRGRTAGWDETGPLAHRTFDSIAQALAAIARAEK